MPPNTTASSVASRSTAPPGRWRLAGRSSRRRSTGIWPSTGKEISKDWVVWSSYNTERAIGRLEVTASQKERDYIAFVNWRKAAAAAAAGKGKMIDGVRVLNPARGAGHDVPGSAGEEPARRRFLAGRPLRRGRRQARPVRHCL